MGCGQLVCFGSGSVCLTAKRYTAPSFLPVDKANIHSLFHWLERINALFIILKHCCLSHSPSSPSIRGLATWKKSRPLLVYIMTRAVPWSSWRRPQEWRKAHLASRQCASLDMTKTAPHQVSTCVVVCVPVYAVFDLDAVQSDILLWCM